MLDVGEIVGQKQHEHIRGCSLHLRKKLHFAH